MANGNQTEREKIQARLKEAQEKAALDQAAYDEKLVTKEAEAKVKVANKTAEIVKAKENLAKKEKQLVDLTELSGKLTAELAEVNAGEEPEDEVQEDTPVIPNFNS